MRRPPAVEISIALIVAEPSATSRAIGLAVRTNASTRVRKFLACKYPIENSRLALGTWQGIYLFEHRSHRQQRRVLMRCLKIE